MKKAKDYIKDKPYLGAFLSSAQGYDIFIKTIRQVQLDTIEETIKKCFESTLDSTDSILEIEEKLKKEISK